MAFAVNARRELERFGQHLCYAGFVVRTQVVEDICNDSMWLQVDYINDHHERFSFSHWESAMGGGDAFRQWAQHVTERVRRTHERLVQEHGEPRVRLDVLYGTATLNPRMVVGIDWGSPRFDAKAESTAEALFMATAGECAHKEMVKRGWTAIKGSKGTDYQLHKRATYCIERPKDGRKLCVVVPGVPLWDHLLGVKLMVEHDEPRFLKTANIA